MHQPVDFDDPFVGLSVPSQEETAAELDRLYENELLRRQLADELDN